MSQNMSLFVSDTIVSYDTQRGVARYFKKIMEGVIAHFGSRVVIYSRNLDYCGAATYIRPVQFRGRRFVHDLLASAAAYKVRAKVFYSPYFGNTRTDAAEVYTVYDMIYELFPHYFPEQKAANRRFVEEKKRCFERADVLFAISASTARDMLACYPGIDASKIVVTPLGVAPFFFETSARQPESGARPFVLYVGNRQVYKNFLRLLIAFGQSGLASEFDLRVISPGADVFSPQEVAYIEQYRLHNSVQLMTAVSEHVLRESYAGAAAFVYPSEYEGFGLSVLEAMASGTLVAISDVSSLPEVAGDVGFYFDPQSTDSIADCLLRVTNLSAEHRKERIAQGIARARTFTWEQCQQQTVDVLRQLM
jgi:glycosyltransferase involved in cell wall biosynthesis